MRTIAILSVVLMAFGLAAVAGPARAGGHHYTAYQVEGTFDDVRQDVLDAIVNRGFVLDFEARISDMLKRTGKDVGATKEIYEDATMLMFCSATYSREAMEADPMNIVFCPYVVNVFKTPDSGGKVTIAYRKPRAAGALASRKALLGIEEMLDGIAREAAGK